MSLWYSIENYKNQQSRIQGDYKKEEKASKKTVDLLISKYAVLIINIRTAFLQNFNFMIDYLNGPIV